MIEMTKIKLLDRVQLSHSQHMCGKKFQFHSRFDRQNFPKTQNWKDFPH